MTNLSLDRLYRVLAEIDPRDRRDTEIHLSGSTARELASGVQNREFSFDEMYTDGSTLLGITVRRDDSMAHGEFRFVTENEQDRTLRRLAGSGMTVNVVKMEPIKWDTPVAQTPSLKALVRHWWKRLKG